jgi:AcrR family transcriptional regulator
MHVYYQTHRLELASNWRRVMAAKAEDRRRRRTRTALLTALLDLIVEKGYAEVTVQDIVDRADVGRSTFYMHFLDKRALLLSGVEELYSFLAQQRAALEAPTPASARLLGYSLPLLEHVQRNVRVCRVLLSAEAPFLWSPSSICLIDLRLSLVLLLYGLCIGQ